MQTQCETYLSYQQLKLQKIKVQNTKVCFILCEHYLFQHMFSKLHFRYGLGSSVGIATGYGLNGQGIEYQWGARFSTPVQTSPGAHPASCTMGTRSFPGVKSGWGVTLTPHPLQVPWSRKSRAIPLLPLWAVRPVQSLSACTVQLYLYSPYGPYSLYRNSVPVHGCTLATLYLFLVYLSISTCFG